MYLLFPLSGDIYDLGVYRCIKNGVLKKAFICERVRECSLEFSGHFAGLCLKTINNID